MNNKSSARQKIKYRIRKKISGEPTKPRLSVFRSNSFIYAQLIDDTTGTTLAAASSKEKDILAQKSPNIEKSKMVGASIGLFDIFSTDYRFLSRKFNFFNLYLHNSFCFPLVLRGSKVGIFNSSIYSLSRWLDDGIDTLPSHAKRSE